MTDGQDATRGWRGLRAALQPLRALALSVLLLAACAAPAEPALPELVREAAARPGPRDARVVGYLTPATGGFQLVGMLRPGGGGLDAAAGEAERVCVEPAAGEAERLAALAPDAAPPALVSVSGTLATAATSGAGCALVLRGARAEKLTPREATVETLLERPEEYAGSIVRVNGALLARPGEALLVEELGPGGAPAPGSRQLKLAGPLPAEALPPELRQAPGSEVRFGPVQVEGLWRDGVLLPLAVVAVTA